MWVELQRVSIQGGQGTSEKPILFNTEMVRAILDGSKTQTRRPITAANSTVCGARVTSKSPLWTGLVWDDNVFPDKGPHILHPSPSGYLHVPWVNPQESGETLVFRVRCRHDVGDRLWLKEAWTNSGEWVSENYIYKANGTPLPQHHTWHSSMSMPRRASRITLELVNVWPERVQEIRDGDIVQEGIRDLRRGIVPELLVPHNITEMRQRFQGLWDSIYAKKGFGWDTNPFCWVYEFKQL